ncbi:hypothetical protein DOM21_04640 [Bacteriovorax stolpii]|uniref:phosphatase PAP2 family protein n=1 Tax=Bacteriovorax stolpii TaxID=960 RepID=UPI0011576ECC|nr:phosphatase PAP2 family protein [Bacteriovorax stolpii]QDK40754.1 hypothetical protein DOM21_04640 [Bacteriovorax stolpii]
MKTALLLLSAITFNLNVYAADMYDSRWKHEVESILSCQNTIQGCTAEQELQIASIMGKTTPTQELSRFIKADKQAQPLYIPLDMKNQELVALAAATSLGVVAFANDRAITDFAIEHKTVMSDPITAVGNFLGREATIPLVAGSYFLGVVYKDNKLKQVALFTVGATIAGQLVTEGAKNLFGRMRPAQSENPYEFFQEKSKSFFSGHTTQAFTIATIVSEMYKDDYPVVPYVAYGLASLTAYARVYGENHWASDVITGAIMGTFVTRLFLSFMKQDKSKENGGFSVSPGIDPLTGTLMVNVNYVPKQKASTLKCAKISDQIERAKACMAEVMKQK